MGSLPIAPPQLKLERLLGVRMRELVASKAVTDASRATQQDRRAVPDDLSPAAVLVRKLQAELGRLRERLARAETTAVPPAERDKELERLRTRNRNLQAEVRHSTKWVDDEKKRFAALRKNVQMPRATFAAINFVLHPDTTPTEEQRNRATQLFNEWMTKSRT
jgi:predicted RNase H-like nuclease (RuvC/YqgF family)